MNGPDKGGAVALPEEEVKTRKMPMYKVIMHNDNTTSMDFVVSVLCQIFNRERQDAVKIMFEIHNKGQGIAGIYALEHAELKVEQTHSLARARSFPLTCTVEQA